MIPPVQDVAEVLVIVCAIFHAMSESERVD